MHSSLSLSPQVFAILSALIEERLGIHYAPADSTVLADKVTPRAVECGFDSLLDYYYYLRYDPGSEVELDQLAEALVVNETYFFREADQLRVLVAHLEERGTRARVWCAASSTGEEPYTLAMMLDERGILDRVEIIASDVSLRAVTRARAGVFRGRALRALPESARLRYFRPDGECVRLDDRIRHAVTFRTINLLDEATIASLGTFDAVLCRNVLIYFRDTGVARVAERLARRLLPGGLLLIGASESLLRFSTTLECVERGGVFLYRKEGS
jgi:chemotaxis protein methyltransferase CheR